MTVLTNLNTVQRQYTTFKSYCQDLVSQKKAANKYA